MEEEGAPPKQRAFLVHGMSSREGGEPPEQERMPFVRGLVQETWVDPKTYVPPTAIQSREEEGARGEYQPRVGIGGGTPPQLGGRGALEQQAWAIMARTINILPGGGPPIGQEPSLSRQHA